MKTVTAHAIGFRNNDDVGVAAVTRCTYDSCGTHTTTATSVRSPQEASARRQSPPSASLIGTLTPEATAAPPESVIE